MKSWRFKDWRFQTSEDDRARPASDTDQELWAAGFELQAGEAVPEQAWTEAFFEAEHEPSRTVFRFSTAEFLAGMNLARCRAQGPCADPKSHNCCGCHQPWNWPVLELPFQAQWRNDLKGDFAQVQPTKDWTHTSCFKGFFGSADDVSLVPPALRASVAWCRGRAPAAGEQAPTAARSEPRPPDLTLPEEELKDQSRPILWFTRLLLYNDDLADRGDATCEVKVRVMEGFWFALAQQRVRVDHAVEREVSTRVWHRFGEGEILRETEWREFGHAGRQRLGLLRESSWKERLLLFYS